MGVGDEVSTRRVVPLVFDVQVGHGDPANAAMTRAVASGSLTWGQ